jgi:hypothetical protein
MSSRGQTFLKAAIEAIATAIEAIARPGTSKDLAGKRRYLCQIDCSSLQEGDSPQCIVALDSMAVAATGQPPPRTYSPAE